MTTWTLLFRSLFHYWRTNLAVMLGVVAGTAVIGGALVVGDSVRDSLERMSLVRLGDVDYALHGQRYFREELAAELAENPEFQDGFSRVAPLLIQQGTFVVASSNGAAPRRVGQVLVYGVDDRAWSLTNHGEFEPPGEDEVLLNSRVAGQLGVQAGDDVRLTIAIPKTIPGETLFGDRDQEAMQTVLTVRTVLPDELGVSRFALDPGQQLPPVAYVSLGRLQRAMNLHRREERNIEEKRIDVYPARVNGLLAQSADSQRAQGETALQDAEALNGLVQAAWTTEDLRLHVRPYEPHGYVTVESDTMVLDDVTADAAREAAEELDLTASPVLVYLANEFTNPDAPDAISLYGVVAGIEFDEQSHFGGFEYTGEAPELPLADDEIVVNSWLAEDLSLEAGDALHLTYHQVGSHGELPELDRDFTVRGILKLDGTGADSQGFTPVVKGVTDVDDYSAWDEPFPMKDVTDRDDDYWEAYRATPKAFVSLKTARELWRSRYGAQTSVRIASPEGQNVAGTRDAVEQTLLETLRPADMGLAFQPVKYQGLQAAAGTQDFTGLFIGFSFFLIVSAVVLVALLFGLGIERRATNVGLLTAIGFTPWQVKRQFFGEGLIVVVVGGVLGVGAALGYAALMIHGLKTWWVGAIGTRFLILSPHPTSLLYGFLGSVAVSGLAVWWGLRQMRKVSTRGLLAGSTHRALTTRQITRRGRNATVVAAVSTGVALLLVVLVLAGAVPSTEAFEGFSWETVSFFVVGTLLLTASLAFLASFLNSDRAAAVRGRGPEALVRLGTRNAARHRQRSIATTALIASATFVIVAVAAGQYNPAIEQPDPASGNGGFLLVAEANDGILADLDEPEGRDKVGLTLEAVNPEKDREDEVRSLLENSLVVPFRVKPGEDASCLNLYRTQLPTILGVPDEMVEMGGFAFTDTPGENPWKLLQQPQEDGTIPVLGDKNTIQYSLKKGVGSTIPVPDEEDPEYTLKIVGMFHGSVFQGMLLMSEENFLNLYPEREGYQYFLVGGKNRDGSLIPPEKTEELSTLYETQLAEYGFDAEPVAQRLRDFLTVQNTYLQTFQTLGGLGLLLGTLGLATVMLRNVLERRPELALLRAVGFRNTSLAGVVLFENAFLLTWGLLAGAVSALLAMTPHLRTTGADVPWIGTALLLLAVLAVGMLAAVTAVAEAVRTPIVATLRSE